MSFKEVEVTCPICEKVKSINIPDRIFSQKKFGNLKIQIPQGAVCAEHQFIAFIDIKGIVHGYEKIDVTMKITFEETIKEKAGVLTLRRMILLFGTYGVLSLMHAKIFNYETYVIINEKFKYNEDLMNLIGDRLLPSNYRGKGKVHLLKETDYGKIKISKETLLLNSQHHILQTPWQEKLKFEEKAVKKALEIFDEEEQLLILQKDIANFIKEAEYTIEILEGVKQIYEDELKKKLSKELMLSKMNRYRFNLIKEFITRRISSKITKKITGDYFGYLKTISQKK